MSLLDRILPELYPEHGDHLLHCNGTSGVGTDWQCYACSIVNGEKVEAVAHDGAGGYMAAIAYAYGGVWTPPQHSEPTSPAPASSATPH